MTCKICEIRRARRWPSADFRRQPFLETADRQGSHPIDEIPALIFAQAIREARHATFRDALAQPPEGFAFGMVEDVRCSEIGWPHL